MPSWNPGLGRHRPTLIPNVYLLKPSFSPGVPARGQDTRGRTVRKTLIYSVIAVVVVIIIAGGATLYLSQRGSQGPESRLVIYSTLDSPSASLLLAAFQLKYPSVEVTYLDKGSSEIFTTYQSERASNSPTADILWSSGADLQYTLLKNYGAVPYRVANYDSLPDSAKYQTLAYVTSYALVAPVFSRQKIPLADQPKSLADTITLLANSSLFPAGSKSVGTFDVSSSGFGLTFTYYLNKTHPTLLQQQLNTASAVQPLAFASTGPMLDRVKTGEFGLVTNMIANYAFRDGAADNRIGAFIPSDVVVLVPRTMFITKEAAHPAAAKAFLDFILSREGQLNLAGAAEVTLTPNVRYPQLSVDAIRGNTTDLVIVKLGDSYLDELLDTGTRTQFIAQWKAWLNLP
ncbi:MAG: ABC transporter substrate-binding protein [Methanobacteriota archaeon]|nr:MAG: ABC transporter substrate-binding protein [Euryarchaeota archaeon]